MWAVLPAHPDLEFAELLKTANPTTVLHEEMIAKLDQIAQIFRVLIIKTKPDDSLLLSSSSSLIADIGPPKRSSDYAGRWRPMSREPMQ